MTSTENAPENDPSILSPVAFHELIVKFIHSHKMWIAAFTVFVFLTFPVESVVLPHFYSKLFDAIKNESGNLSGIFDGVLKNWRTQNAAGLLYVIAAIWIAVIIAYGIKQSIEAVIVPRYLSHIRQTIFSRIINKHQDDFKDIRVGEEITRILDVSRNMRDLLSWGLDEMAPMFVTMCIIAIFFCSVHLAIGGTMLAGIGITLLVLFIWGRKGIDASALREKYYLEMSERLHDSFGNLMNIYINNMKNTEIKSNNVAERRHTELYMRQLQITRNIVVALSFVSILTFMATLVITYYLVKKNVISSITFVSIWIVLMYYISFMVRFSNEFPHFLTKFGTVKNSKKFLDDILVSKQKRHVKDNIKLGEVVFRDVEFTYPGSSVPTLHKFNLHAEPKEKVALLGTSGSGKTTAMKLLAGMYRVNSGEILVDGTNVNTIDLTYLRKKINYVNQRTQLFNSSVLQNMKYGNSASDEDVKKILRDYELDLVFAKLKNGINSNAGVHGANLSLGMQKVTIIVRGLLREEAQVVVLDEPLSGLDTTTRKRVITCIRARCKNKTLIVITHDREIVPYMDRVVHFSDINQKNDASIPVTPTEVPQVM